MLNVIQNLVAKSAVVRGDTVVGYVDHVEIDESGVYIVLQDEPEAPVGEEMIPLVSEIDPSRTAVGEDSVILTFRRA